MDIDFPYGIGADGGTARAAGTRDHVRDMLEMLLFTDPGERPNRPDFGSGLRELVFAPLGPDLTAAVELAVRGAVDRWLGDVVDVAALDVTAEQNGTALTIELSYVIRATGEAVRVVLTPEGPLR